MGLRGKTVSRVNVAQRALRVLLGKTVCTEKMASQASVG